MLVSLLHFSGSTQSLQFQIIVPQFDAWKVCALTERQLLKLKHWGKGTVRAHSIAKCQFNLSHTQSILKPISLLSCPEHHIRSPGETQSGDVNIARNFFPILKLDIISRDNMRQQRLNFIDRKEPSGTESKS
jgi:hypothetical protein